MLDLYEYQKEDVAKAIRQKAVLIGSDMGTGKTIEAIEIANKWRREVLEKTGYWLPILVVAPINTFESWAEKYKEQHPYLKVRVIDVKDRDSFLIDVYNLKYDVYIMHWAAVRLVADTMVKDKIVFSTIIGDEIHYISNWKAATSKHFKNIRCYRKLGMSGTASGGTPWGIWSVLNWLYPSYYSSFWRFMDKYAVKEKGYKYIESDDEEDDEKQLSSYTKYVDVKNVELFHQEVKPFYIRHSKKGACCPNHPNGVMHWLPEKNYKKLYVDLNDEQRRVYDEMFENMVAWVGEQKDTPLIAKIAAVKLMRLLQITLATPSVSYGTKNKKVTYETEDGEKITTTEKVDIEIVDLHAPSSKIDLAIELINEYENESFVVFTPFKKGAVLAWQMMQKAGINCAVLSGDTSQQDRVKLIRMFRNREIRVIIAVIQAAAEGIDGLQDVCSTAIFLNRSFSVIKNAQAEDRLYRGGQHQNVTIIDIIARNTVDGERLEKLDGSFTAIKQLLGLK